MKKTYVLEDLDCAHCAAKMEEAIRKLEGVNSVTVSYIAQKFVLDAEDARFDEILQEAVKICRKVEPDCRIITK
jgi:copper chaperone CopZ